MKTLVTVLVLGLLVVAVPAMATTLWTETFTYSNGNIALAPNVTGGLWVNYSGAGTDVQISSNTAVGIMSNAPDDGRNFTAQDSLAVVYTCFQVTIPTPGTLPIVGNYFAHFSDGGTSNFLTRLWVLPISGNDSHFNFGLAHSSTSSPTVVPVAYNLVCNYGQTYWIVLKYDGPNHQSFLWVNPSSELSTYVAESLVSGGGAHAAPLSRFCLRQSSSGFPSGTSNWTYVVDNVGVGTSFLDACAYTGITPVTNSTWGHLKSLYR